MLDLQALSQTIDSRLAGAEPTLLSLVGERRRVERRIQGVLEELRRGARAS